MSIAPRALRELTNVAERASDAQLLKLVQMVDALPVRGNADAVLEPLRGRLRQVRPPRPLSLPRLLFMPLDALLVPAKDWRPGKGLVPRTAIAPMTAAVAAANELLATEAAAALRGHTLGEQHLVSDWGPRLWLLAGEAMPGRAPPGWSESGLPDGTYPSIALICRTLWRFGPSVWRLRLAGPDGPPEALAKPVLRSVAADGPEALGVVLAALLPFAAQPSALVNIVTGLGRQLSVIAEQTLDRFITEAKPQFEAQDLGAAAAEMDRFAVVLEDLQATVAPNKSSRAQALSGLRQAAGTACLRRLEADAGPRLAQAVSSLAARPAVTDAEVEVLEAACANLRALADAARRLERGPLADRSLLPALAVLTDIALRLPESGPGLMRADALRMMELLGQSEAAARSAGLHAIRAA